MILTQVLKSLYRPVRDMIIDITHVVLGIVPPQKGLIVFTSWFAERYADNTMYLFEDYMRHHKQNVVWITRNETVYKELGNINYPVIKANSLKGIWTVLRADCLLSTVQLNDYSSYLLTNTTLVDLDHGIPFKQAGYAINSSDNVYLKKHDAIVSKRIRYYLTATSYPCALMLSKIYNIPLEHIILCGKPRDDAFGDNGMRKENDELKKLIENKKTITYMPTHRNCGKELLNIEKHLDLDYIDQVCNDYGYVFLVKRHYYHKNERTDLSAYNNIVDITDMDIDPQYLLYKTDVLISDYSSVCPEFLLLDRPIILYPYDLDHYLEYDRDLFFPMNSISFVDKPKTVQELNDSIRNVVLGIDNYKSTRPLFKKLFFDEEIEKQNACSRAKQVIERILIDKNYIFDWAPYKEKYKEEELVKMINYIEDIRI